MAQDMRAVADELVRAQGYEIDLDVLDLWLAVHGGDGNHLFKHDDEVVKRPYA